METILAIADPVVEPDPEMYQPDLVDEESVYQEIDTSKVLQYINTESSPEAAQYISTILSLKQISPVDTMVMPSSLTLHPDFIPLFSISCLLDFKPLNKTGYINKYIKAINRLLPDEGVFITRFESMESRTIRLFGKGKGMFISMLKLTDFFIHRVIPRLSRINKIYFRLTRGRYRVISLAEGLGRISSCGFRIMEHKVIGNHTYVLASKKSNPEKVQNPTYGPFIKLERVGQNHNMMGVYKFRTMHPFSEFIQDYVVRLNGYNEVGKPANDFRVTEWGKLFRKYWLDETPQIINVFKGEMRLVGVRPLSKTRFNELPVEVQEARVKEKPGCIPPYVALNMPSATDNIEAEIIYLKEKASKKSHISKWFVNVRYCFMALSNIFLNKIVSG